MSLQQKLELKNTSKRNISSSYELEIKIQRIKKFFGRLSDFYANIKCVRNEKNRFVQITEFHYNISLPIIHERIKNFSEYKFKQIKDFSFGFRYSHLIYIATRR